MNGCAEETTSFGAGCTCTHIALLFTKELHTQVGPPTKLFSLGCVLRLSMLKNSCVRKNRDIDDFDINIFFANASSPHDRKMGHRGTCTEIAQTYGPYVQLQQMSLTERNLEWNSATNPHERQKFSL